MRVSLINYKSIFFLILVFLLTSCSEIGLLSEKNSWIVNNIDSVGSFFKVYLVLQLSIIIVGLFLGIFIGRLGYVISLAIHFIWIVSARDYGFFKVLLLFGLFAIVSRLINLLREINKQSNY